MTIECKECGYKYSPDRLNPKYIEVLSWDGYDYDHSVCPSCNAGKYIRHMDDKGEKIRTLAMMMMPKRVVFGENDKCADKFDFIRGLVH